MQALQAALDSQKVSLDQRHTDTLLDNLDRARWVVTGQGLLQRLVDEALSREPVGCAAMQVGDLFAGEHASESVPEGVAEQCVTAIPSTPLVNRIEQALPSHQLFEERLTLHSRRLFRKERIDQLSADLIDDRRPQQDLLHLGRLEGEHLVQQEFLDVAMAPRVERLDPYSRVGLLFEH
jgi:hypothetical protein